jgi:DNA-binding NtrC family response regulator
MPEIVLIVDDEENVRNSLAGVMKDEGYVVVTASSGREGIALLSSISLCPTWTGSRHSRRYVSSGRTCR